MYAAHYSILTTSLPLCDDWTRRFCVGGALRSMDLEHGEMALFARHRHKRDERGYINLCLMAGCFRSSVLNLWPKLVRKAGARVLGKTYFRRRTNRTDHFLNQLHSHLFPAALPHGKRHVFQKRRVADIRSVTVAHDIRGPLKLGCVGVTCTDVLVLQSLELLCGAKFVGLISD